MTDSRILRFAELLAEEAEGTFLPYYIRNAVARLRAEAEQGAAKVERPVCEAVNFTGFCQLPAGHEGEHSGKLAKKPPTDAASGGERCGRCGHAYGDEACGCPSCPCFDGIAADDTPDRCTARLFGGEACGEWRSAKIHDKRFANAHAFETLPKADGLGPHPSRVLCADCGKTLNDDATVQPPKPPEARDYALPGWPCDACGSKGPFHEMPSCPDDSDERNHAWLDPREIKLSDLWDAFEAGAGEHRKNPHATDSDISQACDAYVKLWTMRNERKPEARPPPPQRASGANEHAEWLRGKAAELERDAIGSIVSLGARDKLRAAAAEIERLEGKVGDLQTDLAITQDERQQQRDRADRLERERDEAARLLSEWRTRAIAAEGELAEVREQAAKYLSYFCSDHEPKEPAADGIHCFACRVLNEVKRLEPKP